MGVVYSPPAGTNKLLHTWVRKKKINLSQNPRAFLTGSFLWLNKVAGRYQAEPALLSPTNATADSTAANSSASTYTTGALANAAFAPLFLGIADEQRIPAQLNQFGSFGTDNTATVYPMDASTPFINYWSAGEMLCPVGPNLSATGVLTSAIEVGTLVMPDYFVCTASGFNDPAGKLQTDTKYYLYNNCVYAPATDAAHAIGVVTERGEIGAAFLVVQFNSYAMDAEANFFGGYSSH